MCLKLQKSSRYTVRFFSMIIKIYAGAKSAFPPRERYRSTNPLNLNRYRCIRLINPKLNKKLICTYICTYFKNTLKRSNTKRSFPPCNTFFLQIVSEDAVVFFKIEQLVEVLKTNVEQETQAAKLLAALADYFPSYMVYACICSGTPALYNTAFAPVLIE